MLEERQRVGPWSEAELLDAIAQLAPRPTGGRSDPQIPEGLGGRDPRQVGQPLTVGGELEVRDLVPERARLGPALDLDHRQVPAALGVGVVGGEGYLLAIR